MDKLSVYNRLVNRHIGITYRYHRFHDGSSGAKKVLSWGYLLWLNFAYHALFCRYLDKAPDIQMYEEKNLNLKKSESQELSVKDYVDMLKKHDVISFDIFDTLILRPLDQPADVFYFIGEKLGISNFKNIRVWAEWDARVKSKERYGHTEIGLEDIWNNLTEDVGNMADEGMQIEIDTELGFCYANPFMLQVWNELRKLGKDIIVVSDMYLPEKVLARMLDKNGYTGYKKLYVSCEYKKNKASGSLYRLVKKEWQGKHIIHVGDNPHSDVKMAVNNGFSSCHYPNVNHNMIMYRPYDMSYIVGSAYRGIVSGWLYNGLKSYSMEYEYGFIYGGLFALGYCNFIHEYCIAHSVDTLLFLSRDGDILKQAYDKLYPDDNTRYVYWSRKAATVLMADEDKHDYFRRFIYHKVNQKYTIKDILESMGIGFLIDELSDWHNIWLDYESKKRAVKKNKTKFIDLHAEDELTDKNGYLLRRFIEAKWDKVIKSYENQGSAARYYYEDILSDSAKAVAVDIGWAGSGAMALSHLVEKVWRIPCSITGIIAGTNTVHNTEPDASEGFLQNGKLVAYMYSQNHNRDLLKKHDPNKDYNVFWELLLSSPTKQFTGFDLGNDNDIILNFGKLDANQKGIHEIQKGIMDFITEYIKHFNEFAYMFNISGRDAYAPMIVAASHNEKYLKAIENKFNLEINVN